MKPNPCPWCDSTASIEFEDLENEDVDYLAIITYHFVQCDSCGAQGPCVDRQGTPLTKNEAIERWNEVAP